MRRISWCGVLTVGILLPGLAHGQAFNGSWAWKPLLQHEGVEFAYLFYREADSRHNGVVLMLHNTNAYPVTYRFKVIFRSGQEEVVESVEGELAAGERKTGDREGLFWIPFRDGREIGEVGLRGYAVTRQPPPGTEGEG